MTPVRLDPSAATKVVVVVQLCWAMAVAVAAGKVDLVWLQVVVGPIESLVHTKAEELVVAKGLSPEGTPFEPIQGMLRRSFGLLLASRQEGFIFCNHIRCCSRRSRRGLHSRHSRHSLRIRCSLRIRRMGSCCSSEVGGSRAC